MINRLLTVSLVGFFGERVVKETSSFKLRRL